MAYWLSPKECTMTFRYCNQNDKVSLLYSFFLEFRFDVCPKMWISCRTQSITMRAATFDPMRLLLCCSLPWKIVHSVHPESVTHRAHHSDIRVTDCLIVLGWKKEIFLGGKFNVIARCSTERYGHFKFSRGQNFMPIDLVPSWSADSDRPSLISWELF